MPCTERHRAGMRHGRRSVDAVAEPDYQPHDCARGHIGVRALLRPVEGARCGCRRVCHLPLHLLGSRNTGLCQPGRDAPRRQSSARPRTAASWRTTRSARQASARGARRTRAQSPRASLRCSGTRSRVRWRRSHDPTAGSARAASRRVTETIASRFDTICASQPDAGVRPYRRSDADD